MIVITVDPPILPLSGLAKKQRYWKTAVKAVIHNQEKRIRDLKISGGIGGGGQRRGGIGGTTVVSAVISRSLERQWYYCSEIVLKASGLWYGAAKDIIKWV